jgi:c-di-GMP-related signal transduction protein
MEELTPSLPLRDGIRDALKGRDNPERGLLQWLECHERGDWKASDEALHHKLLGERKQLQCYADAIVWAEAAMHSAG